MKLDRVTVTGADDSTKISDMIRLTHKYPFVEWGILVSAKTQGTRFPSDDWLDSLMAIRDDIPEMKLSCHVCGQWVREICFNGRLDTRLEELWAMFQRVQLNFHAIVHEIDKGLFQGLLSDPEFMGKQFIFQLDDVNNHILDIAQESEICAVPLFDRSGGIGVLPDAWPDIRDKTGYCGYAGGLSPSNLREQLAKIEEVTGDNTIWVDAETHLRSDNDRLFDMKKVEDFLSIAKEYVVREEAPQNS